MVDYGSEILEMLEGQADHYQTLMRIMLRQAECLRKDDLIGVGSATAEIRKVMEHVDGLGNSLTPLIAQWGGRVEMGGRISEVAKSMHRFVAELEELRAKNLSLAKEGMDKRRKMMVTLSTGESAMRGYSPRPSKEARFVDRTR